MRTCLCLSALIVSLVGTTNAADLVLKKGDRLAIIGDSITEQKLYSKYIETPWQRSVGR
jgi:hypothetical protein